MITKEREMKQHIYRAWIKPLKRYASDITMEFTSYGIPPMISACMQGEREYSGDDVILEQCTGLTDVFESRIFEGDIVVNTNPITDSFCDVSVVSYHPLGFYSLLFESIGRDVLVGEHDHLKVIGNINENPELLTDPK